VPMGTTPPAGQPDDPRLRARADLLWYLRHADALARWPALKEPWAQRIERRRLAPDDGRPPGGSGARRDVS
jgi:hypothetical protein